jgi:small neutral amino acid transporter SnatA (MarC family)
MPTIIILSGLFIISAAVLDWEWFFANWRAALFLKVFGRNGARIFYGLLGVLALVLGFNMSS